MIQNQALKNKDNDYSFKQEEYFKKTGLDILDPFIRPFKWLNQLSVSIIIPASNVQSSILSCLYSIQESSFNRIYPESLEVIVISDGSTDMTWDLLKNTKFSMNLKVVKQEHLGQSHALNTGISISKGEVIICSDADMVLSYYTIEQFVSIHHKFRNDVLVGFRSNVSPEDSRINVENLINYGTHSYSEFFGDERIIFSIPGWPENMCNISDNFKNLGYKKGLWMRGDEPWLLGDLLFGALFCISRKQILEIGGFDERFSGWGCSDGYLASKAISLGAYIIPIYSASGLHISHPDRSVNKQSEYNKNRILFHDLILKSDTNDYPNYLRIPEARILEMYSYEFDNKRNINKNEKIDNPKFFIEDSLIALGKFSKALEILSMQSGDQAFLRVAKCQNGLGKYDEARKSLSKIKEIDNIALTELVFANAGLGDFSSANIIINKKINKDFKKYFDDSKTYTKKGDLFMSQNFWKVAIKCYELALAIDPLNKITSLKRQESIKMLTTE